MGRFKLAAGTAAMLAIIQPGLAPGGPAARAADRGPRQSRSLPPPVPCDAGQGRCRRPPQDARWQYQLQGVSGHASTGGIDVDIAATPWSGGEPVSPDVFDIDLYVDQAISGNNHTLATDAVQAIHDRGGHAICYVDAGTWEDWRPDADRFPDPVKGRNNGWPGERWLDIRQRSVLMPIMKARASRCGRAGFDGLEWDNVDGYANNSGFPLSYADQARYDALLANVAHRIGLTVALKNDLDQVGDLLPYFDYAVNEQCRQYAECGTLDPFLEAGDPVFEVEYRVSPDRFCPPADRAGRSAIQKRPSLYDTPWVPCR